MLKIAMAQIILNIVVLVFFAYLVKTKSLVESLAERISWSRESKTSNDKKAATQIRKMLAVLHKNNPLEETIKSLSEDKSSKVFNRRIDVFFMKNPHLSGTPIHNDLRMIQRIASSAGERWIRYR
jgi:Sec7-like guanine-nucleotide exchange factor